MVEGEAEGSKFADTAGHRSGLLVDGTLEFADGGGLIVALLLGNDVFVSVELFLRLIDLLFQF